MVGTDKSVELRICSSCGNNNVEVHKQGGRYLCLHCHQEHFTGSGRFMQVASSADRRAARIRMAGGSQAIC